MIKIIDILTSVISEQKRFQFDPETYNKLVSLTEKLWNIKNKEFKKKTHVDSIRVKTSDGTEGLVKIVISPRLKYIGFLDTKPKFSRDPMDFVM